MLKGIIVPVMPATEPRITLRDRIALAAVPELLKDHVLGEDHLVLVGVDAYLVADVLLRARKLNSPSLAKMARRLRGSK